MEDQLAQARAVMRNAQRITVLTGAGISTDSGIPDFRGPQGTWTLNPAAEKTATLQTYLSDPDVRRASWRNRVDSPAWHARPNPGHEALVTLEKQGRLRALLTQNIDELHQQAGSDPALVVELHGTMWKARCWACGWEGPMAPVLDRVRAGDPDPSCEVCNGILKSSTISFGQSLEPRSLQRAQQASEDCDLFLAVGSTLSVYPAAGFVEVAWRRGAGVVIVNADETPFDGIAAAVVNGSISEFLPRLVAGNDG